MKIILLTLACSLSISAFAQKVEKESSENRLQVVSSILEELKVKEISDIKFERENPNGSNDQLDTLSFRLNGASWIFTDYREFSQTKDRLVREESDCKKDGLNITCVSYDVSYSSPRTCFKHELKISSSLGVGGIIMRPQLTTMSAPIEPKASANPDESCKSAFAENVQVKFEEMVLGKEVEFKAQ